MGAREDKKPQVEKTRTKRDWKAIAAGRNNKPRELRNGRGLTNVPSMMDVGSAAYRRLMAKQTGKR